MIEHTSLETPDLAQHAAWAMDVAQRHHLTAENVEDILKAEVGAVFVQVLEDAGVYPQSEEGKAGRRRFIEACGGDMQSLEN